MSKWNHIDTVPPPKDGSEFLACYSRQFKEGPRYKDYSIVKWDSQAKDFVGRCEGTDAIRSESWAGTEYLYPWFNFWRPLPDIEEVEE